MRKDWKERLGMVYSTNPSFQFDKEEKAEDQTLSPSQQNLRIWLDRKQRKGKSVTLVKGFSGSDDDLQELSRMLKTRLGTGGSAKDGEIIIQGDFCNKVVEILLREGYKAKRAGG